MVYLGLILPQAILVESFLGFLGLSVDEPSASWGTLLYEGSQELDSAPWTLLFPAGFLVATLAGFQFLGDGLRDWLDVRGEAASEPSCSRPQQLQVFAAGAFDAPCSARSTWNSQAGDCLGLIGESGSGKSLTALALMGLLPPGLRATGHLRFRRQADRPALAGAPALRGRGTGLDAAGSAGQPASAAHASERN